MFSKIQEFRDLPSEIVTLEAFSVCLWIDLWCQTEGKGSMVGEKGAPLGPKVLWSSDMALEEQKAMPVMESFIFLPYESMRRTLFVTK